MPAPKSTAPLTPDDLLALRQQLIQQLAGPQSIETPFLGRVEFAAVADILRAISALDYQLGAGGARTFVAQSNRGTNGGYCS
jgi:hypothetical protein